ncbi:MAG: BON domain-containing protein [Acidobacteriia bacterium]|nr:BON domain-containing protein [Terriglobia bacterium]
MKGILSLAAAAACVLLLVVAVSAQVFPAQAVSAQAVSSQAHGGRYDEQIRSEVAKLLAAKSECKNVKATVDDGVVTLTGNVELDSERRTLVTRVRRIAHVEEVDSQILLSPPAPLDNVLYARVSRRLHDAGYAQVTIQVHEGAVILQGSVRTMRDRHSVLQLAWNTEGVKEVEAKLSVMQPDAH